MANELKYILWGIGMMLHALYILKTGIISFGWDTVHINDDKLYFIAIPYLIFSLWLIIYSGIKYLKSKI